MRKYLLTVLSLVGIVGFGLTVMAGAASASTGGQPSGKPTGQPVLQPYGGNNPCGDDSKCQKQPPQGGQQGYQPPPKCSYQCQPQPVVYTPPPAVKCPQGQVLSGDRCVPCQPKPVVYTPPPVVKCPQGTVRQDNYCVPCRPVPVVYTPPPVVKCPQGTVRQYGSCVPCRPVPVVYVTPKPCKTPAPVTVVYVAPKPVKKHHHHKAQVCTNKDIKAEFALLKLEQQHHHLTSSQQRELNELFRLCGAGRG
jgi:hypothetical protein